MQIKTENLSVYYEAHRAAINNISINIEPGTFNVIHGPSGSGKTTLLSCLGLLLTPTSGKLWFGRREVSNLKETVKCGYRNQRIGFIFQESRLINCLSSVENITLPARLGLICSHEAESKARRLLGELGLSTKEKIPVSSLSGGEKQKVAIARAFANSPELLFSDEPTAALDPESTKLILMKLKNWANLYGKISVMITHDPSILLEADNVIKLVDGKVTNPV